MKTSTCFLSFTMGVVIGVAGHWYLTQPKTQEFINDTRASARENASQVGDSLKQTFDSEAIKAELARTGKVVREKAGQAGDAISDATANARITTAIKTKLLADSGLAAFKIDVDTTDGVVTLSGKVPSAEEISHAMQLALEVEGVQRVVSTLVVQE
jgi:hyperosmotically inducible protein